MLFCCILIGHFEEKYISTGIAMNKLLNLIQFTGFQLGPVLAQMGLPIGMGDISNIEAVQFLKNYWKSNAQLSSHTILSNNRVLKEANNIAAAAETSSSDSGTTDDSGTSGGRGNDSSSSSSSTDPIVSSSNDLARNDPNCSFDSLRDDTEQRFCAYTHVSIKLPKSV